MGQYSILSNIKTNNTLGTETSERKFILGTYVNCIY